MDQKSLNPSGGTTVHLNRPFQASKSVSEAKRDDEFARFEDLTRKLTKSPKPSNPKKSD